MDEIDPITSQLNQLNENQVEELRTRVKKVLTENPDNLKAWSVLARVTTYTYEKISALNNIIRLNPKDEWAKNQLDLISKGNLTYEMNMEALMRAKSLEEKGKVKQAEFLIDHVLQNNPHIPDAWYMKARITRDEKAAVDALRQILRIDPDHEAAKKRLALLLRKQTSIKHKRSIPVQYILLGLAGLFVLFGAVTAIIRPFLIERTPTTVADSDGAPSVRERLDCRDVINNAMAFSDITCEKIGRNQVCYGNYDIYADLLEGVTEPFTAVGDIIGIEKVRRLVASPLNMEKELWGIAILKLPANLPGTLPGQNVTFMILGDTSVNNTSGDMTAFYFTSGLTGIKCAQIPFDGVFIETQNGQGIAFKANGVDIVLEGSSFLQAQPEESMTVTILKGTGTVSAKGHIRKMSSRTSVSVPMDWGLNPSGPPSEPEPLPGNNALAACQLFGVECPPEAAAAAPTNTPVPLSPDLPTNTPVPVTPGQPTNTSVPLPTNTSVPIPTNTSASLPTNTPTRTPTDTPIGFVPTPTNTPVPPTPTNTSAPPTATNTQIPPTATNTPIPPTATTSACSGISSGSLIVNSGSKTILFNITNDSGSAIIIDAITLSWPVGTNGSMEEITLGGVKIFFNNPVAISPVSIPVEYSWKTGSGTRKLDPGTSKDLEFLFELDAYNSGYSVNVDFDNGCTIYK
ncbi:MAG: hypothetical protein PVF83_09625 [Anaerolineales bacterium]